MIKDKPRLNLIIDIIMFFLMMSIAGIGLLMKYILIPGFQRNAIYGNDVDLTYLGFTRHQWGTLHLTTGIALLVLLCLHILLHWKMILCIFQRMIPHKVYQIIAAALLTGLGLLMISFSLFIEPEQVSRELIYRNKKERLDTVASIQAITSKQDDSHHNHSNYEEYEIYGYNTLQSVADKYNVPVSVIARDLHIPRASAEQKLGRLKKHYDFTMTDVRKSVYNYIKQNNNDMHQ